MRKAIFLMLPFAVFVLVTAVFALAETARSPDWEVELNHYLTTRNQTGVDPVTLKHVVRATKPWNFREDMFSPEFGNNPLPYPPEQVQCILLVNAQREPEVIFVSYHTDQLWNIEWVIHKSVHPPSSAAFSEDLQTMGCDLNL